MIKRLIQLNMFIFLWSFALQAQDAVSLIEVANKAYQEKAFDEAIGAYTKILESENQSIAVYNNLGSSYFKKNDVPNAILYFEKGLKMDPFDKSLQQNLDIAQEQLDNGIVHIPEFILKKAWKYLFTRASSNTWYILGLLTAFLSVFAFGVWLLNASRNKKKRGFFGGFLFLGLSILFFAFAVSQAKFQYRIKTAIIIDKAVDLKSAPEEANEAIMTLMPGTKLRIVDQIGDYNKVRLGNGQLGWIPKGSYQAI